MYEAKSITRQGENTEAPCVRRDGCIIAKCASADIARQVADALNNEAAAQAALPGFKGCPAPDDWTAAALRELISQRAQMLEALALLLNGAEQAQKQGLNQPQVNGGVCLAKAAIARAKGDA